MSLQKDLQLIVENQCRLNLTGIHWSAKPDETKTRVLLGTFTVKCFESVCSSYYTDFQHFMNQFSAVLHI